MVPLLQITGIGLRMVFALVAQARCADAQMCEHALRALLDVLQGHAPEELHQEPAEVSHYTCTLLIHHILRGQPTHSCLTPK